MLLKVNCLRTHVGHQLNGPVAQLRKNGVIRIHAHTLSNSYTMACPTLRGDNPQTLASGLSYVQADKHGITI